MCVCVCVRACVHAGVCVCVCARALARARVCSCSAINVVSSAWVKVSFILHGKLT